MVVPFSLQGGVPRNPVHDRPYGLFDSDFVGRAASYPATGGGAGHSSEVTLPSRREPRPTSAHGAAVLILSGADDAHVPYVAAKLEARGVEYLWFDTARFPAQAHMRIGLDQRGVTCRSLRCDGREFDLASVTAVWYRRPGKPEPPAELRDETQRNYSEWTSTHFLEGVWETLDCQWLPAKPAASRFAHNKVVQLALASRLGFAVPQTLITNEPAAFMEFYGVCDAHLVSKPLRDTEPKRGGEQVFLFTNPVHRRDAQAYQSIRYAPEIFQRYVRKQSELRVTVVGTRVFAAEIDSQGSRVTRHDWRHYRR
ncbi:MAG: ATP-dependent carboxylate-amine ligase [Gemmatimonadota bacterium]|nr:ATP-dependent carboxylate-amine ligase [Gemmatimonadota bacterium]